MSSSSTTFRAGLRIEAAMFAIALLLLSFAAITLLAAPDPVKEADLTWQRNWKNYARRCIKLRDHYYTCATYDPQFPSSRGITTVALRQKTSKEVTERTGTNVKVRKNLVKPNEEIDAGARSLPEVAAGHYGTIQSAEVLDVLGPDEMVIAGIWLVDPQQLQADREKEKEKLLEKKMDKGDVSAALEWLFETRDELVKKQGDRAFRQPLKLRGVSTAGFAKGDRWTGKGGSPQIAIVGYEIKEQTTTSKKTKPLLVAVPVELFGKPIADEAEFIALLATRGFTKEKFVALMQEERKLNGADERLADAFIFAKLEGRNTEKQTEPPATKPKTPSKPSF